MGASVAVAFESYCYLLGEAPTPEAATRLAALVSTNDGFALAEVDLDLRGEGTLLGARQQGRSDLQLARLRTDVDLLEGAQRVAGEIVSDGGDTLREMQDELRLFVSDDDAAYLFKS